MKLSEIARHTGRDPRTIWMLYHRAQKKHPSMLLHIPSAYHIPLSILKDERLSVLESIVAYLKDHYSLGYTEIARLIGRDPRNIWGAYNNPARRKNG